MSPVYYKSPEGEIYEWEAFPDHSGIVRVYDSSGYPRDQLENIDELSIPVRAALIIIYYRSLL